MFWPIPEARSCGRRIREVCRSDSQFVPADAPGFFGLRDLRFPLAMFPLFFYAILIATSRTNDKRVGEPRRVVRMWRARNESDGCRSWRIERKAGPTKVGMSNCRQDRRFRQQRNDSNFQDMIPQSSPTQCHEPVLISGGGKRWYPYQTIAEYC
jgi:hypothetical protein